ncbi:hypothetical protein ACSMXN_02885 [Jatrophihabitans sp. DSM 45814]
MSLIIGDRGIDYSAARSSSADANQYHTVDFALLAAHLERLIEPGDLDPDTSSGSKTP